MQKYKFQQVKYSTSKQLIDDEAVEMSMDLCREGLDLQYVVTVKCNINNPGHDCIFKPKYWSLYLSKPDAIPPSLCAADSLALLALLASMDLENSTQVPAFPPWTFWLLEFDLSLKIGKIDQMNKIKWGNWKERSNEQSQMGLRSVNYAVLTHLW